MVIRDRAKLLEAFDNFDIDSVIYFAGLKAVGESVEKPLEYYGNNVSGTIKLLEVISEWRCKKDILDMCKSSWNWQKQKSKRIQIKSRRIK